MARPLYQRVLIVVGGGLALAFLLFSVFPASKRVAAPIACPSGYDRSVVVLFSSTSSSPGKSSTTTWSDLWCVFPTTDRYPVPANELVAFAVLWVAGSVIGTLLMGALAFGANRAPRPT